MNNLAFSKMMTKPSPNKYEDVKVYVALNNNNSDEGNDNGNGNGNDNDEDEDNNSNSYKPMNIIMNKDLNFDYEQLMETLQTAKINKVRDTRKHYTGQRKVVEEDVNIPRNDTTINNNTTKDKTKTKRKTNTKTNKTKKAKIQIQETIDEDPDEITILPGEAIKVAVYPYVTSEDIMIGDTALQSRLPNERPVDVNIVSSNYYMNNRKKFSSFINSTFEPYKAELENLENTLSCDTLNDTNKDSKLQLLLHQQIVRDYLNLNTPYRGLLLYHGLGSGKTCSSIAIAEGMKRVQKVIIMTPASLRPNYIEEIKKCGEFIYHRNQYWEWISTITHPEAIEPMASVLNMSPEFIRKRKGAWFINTSKPSNYDIISQNNEHKRSLEEQLNIMIKSKYNFVNFNGLTERLMKELTKNYTINPFDNAVVIIDEAHNLISRIVNKYKREGKMTQDDRGEFNILPTAISTKLYHYLMSAENTKIVLLTGTPIINYPNEFGILFNILRGYIKTWTFNLRIKSKDKIDEKSMTKILSEENSFDYIEYSPTTSTLVITRNPFGFKNTFANNEYKGVTNVGVEDYVSDEQFESNIINILKKKGITLNSKNGVVIKHTKSMPDTLAKFDAQYIDYMSRKIKNQKSIQKRIIGLTSYFKSAQESLLPKYDKILDEDYHIIKIPMSGHQFQKYAEARKIERPTKTGPIQKTTQQSELFKDNSSTYRIFSRLICNFALPDRPFPFKNKNNENLSADDTLKLLQNAEKINVNIDLEGDDILEKESTTNYKEQIDTLLDDIRKEPELYLSRENLNEYSPKFLKLLDVIKDDINIGNHLIYTQFRTLEGIALIAEMLKFHGFAQFKVSKNTHGNWFVDIHESDRGKPTFALYTGTESVEEKEMTRYIYNGEWDKIPDSIANQLKNISNNNNLGEIIKVFMITSSGSEGINLKNTRFVHIIDPYWHPVRSEQVIGRARRICSHNNLPKELQTVNVFVYLMTFTDKLIDTNFAIELKLHDRSKLVKDKIISTDEYLFEISEIKGNITKQLTDIIKQSAFDCNIHSNDNCLQVNFNKNDDGYQYNYVPDYQKQQTDAIQEANLKVVHKTYTEIKINGKIFVFDDDDKLKREFPVFDENSIKQLNRQGQPVNPLRMGTVKKVNGTFTYIPLNKT